MESNNAIAVFEDKKIRKTWFNEEWWFSVVDIVEALTSSLNPRNYWNMLKIREKDSSEFELNTICV
jgi:DNA-damage-inducible protein D